MVKQLVGLVVAEQDKLKQRIMILALRVDVADEFNKINNWAGFGQPIFIGEEGQLWRNTTAQVFSEFIVDS